jgi:hypothetical protein
MTYKIKVRTVMIALIPICVICLGFVLITSRNVVHVKIIGLNKNVTFVCIIAKRTPLSRPSPLYFVRDKVLAHSVNPLIFPSSNYEFDIDGRIFRDEIRWENCHSYGVLTRARDEKWMIYWVNREAMILEWTSMTEYSGEVIIDIKGSVGEQVDEEWTTRLK